MRGIPGVNEKDWKLFRSRIPDWQEAYIVERRFLLPLYARFSSILK